MRMPHRECDLVLKGGIVSGVVHAGAIAELGREFRFRRIGGTSAGAIGAAVAAAAEYARSRDGLPEMTGRLQLLIEHLTTQGFFPRLLQPFPAGRPVLAVLLALLRQERRPVLRAIVAVWRMEWARWWLPLLTAVATVVAVWAVLTDEGVSTPTTIALLALVALVALLVGVGGPALLLLAGAWKGLAAPANRFGLCSGISTGSTPALTDWLHATIQRIAGLPGYRPLTFADLDAAEIDLAMITTDLASARPLRLPVPPGDGVGYWYDPAELRGLFPAAVCEYLEGLPGEPDVLGLRELPTRDLPVIVALRMSLSVPLLLACVPLYAAAAGERPSRDRRTWLTDGGVTSNFPIHFFDAWLPRRPTFGLDLRPVTSPDVDRVHLPDPDTPPEPRWEGIDGPVALLRQVADAAQNWRDTAQAELPGFRDRVCQVRLYPGEGGLHVNMPAAGIQKLIDAGRDAGRKFADEFGEQRTLDHQARRYLILMRLLQANLEELEPAFDLLAPRLVAGLPRHPAYDPPFELRASIATQVLLASAALWRDPLAIDFALGIEASPPPGMQIGPVT